MSRWLYEQQELFPIKLQNSITITVALQELSHAATPMNMNILASNLERCRLLVQVACKAWARVTWLRMSSSSCLVSNCDTWLVTLLQLAVPCTKVPCLVINTSSSSSSSSAPSSSSSSCAEEIIWIPSSPPTEAAECLMLFQSCWLCILWLSQMLRCSYLWCGS